MTPPKSQLAFQLKTLFMGSDGTIPENYARTERTNGVRQGFTRFLGQRLPATSGYAT